MLNIEISRLRRTAVLFLYVVLLATAVTAHPLSEALSDPSGMAYFKRLSTALTSADMDPSNEAFRKLFLDDPNLSRRAFVASVDSMLELMQTDQEAAKAPASVAFVLANLISDQFGDNKPLEIVKTMSDGKEASLSELVVYLDTLRTADRPTAAEGHYGADQRHAKDLPPEAWVMLKPLLVKLMRMQYALAVANPELIISELDTYGQVETAFEKALVAAGVDPAESQMGDKAETDRILSLKKLTVLAEVGLLDEFEKGSRELLAKETDPLSSTAILLSGFRAAFRQNRIPLAQEYVEKARALLSDPACPTDPVLEYSVRTAEYQLRRLKSFQPSEAEMVAEFQQAWSALDSYQPLVIVAHEQNWFYGRMATRYWMDELTKYPESAGIQGLAVLTQVVKWADGMDPALLDSLDNDEALVHPDESFGMVVFLLALTDQIGYACETIPGVMEQDGMLSTVDELETLTNMFVEIQTEMGLSAMTGPGFPPYDIASGGLLPELRARCRYLRGISKETPKAKRAAQLSEAVSMIAGCKNPDVTVDYLLKAGQKLSGLGHYDEAVAAWKQALSIADELSFVQRSLDATTLLAKEYGRRGDWVNASAYADRANDKIQDTAPMLGIRSPEGKAMASKSQTLTAISVKAAVEADDPEKALAVLTRSQQVQSAAVQMSGQKKAQADAHEVFQKEEQVVALAQEVKKLEAMPASGTRDALLESTQGLLADTKAKFLTESRSLRQKYSALYSQVLRFDPLNLPDIQKTLPPDLAVVQYFPTDDALYIFVVTHDNFRLRQVPTTRTILEESTRNYTRAIRRATDKDPVVKAESRKLYNALFAPVEADINGCTTLVLIPSGRLNSLPFASLTNTADEPLGQSRRLLELAKPTDLMRISTEKPKPIESVVAFANATGDLPAAGKEGEAIAALFPNHKLFEGKDATKAAFVEFGGKAEALHLATHGEWNMEDSLANYLAMATGEKVAQDEIFSLTLDNTSIVILSACNTAMGDGGDVKYVASLAEAFWIAGSRSVVASLWAVNDESTSLLMTQFYKSLKTGDGKAEALRKAQMAVRANPKFAHPYFWSGFILFGDWR